MKPVLIYYESEEGSDINIKEFDSVDELVNFVNEEKIGGRVLAAYEVFRELRLKAVDKVVLWGIET